MSSILYFIARYRIYHHALEQWLNSLRQLGLGLIALLPMAIYVLIFTPLLVLGILADPATQTTVFVSTLWGYLLLTYSWIRFQRDALRGSQFDFFLSSLPTPPLIRKLATILMLLYSANFLILGPYVLLAAILIQKFELLQATPERGLELIPLLCTLCLTTWYSVLALRGKPPWLSLAVMPFVVMPWPELFSKAGWALLYLVVSAMEQFIPSPKPRLGIKPKGFFRFYLAADMAKPQGEALRLISLLLLIAITQTALVSVTSDTAKYYQYLFCFCSALILASSFFGVKKLNSDYHYYLASQPSHPFKKHAMACLYALTKTTIGVVIMLVSGLLSPIQWGLWIVLFSSAMLGAMRRPALFFLFPVIITTGFILLSML